MPTTTDVVTSFELKRSRQEERREEYEGHLYPLTVSLRVRCQNVRYLVIVMLPGLSAGQTLKNCRDA